MSHQHKTPLLISILVLSVGPLVFRASACSVPVFRYALEHWFADPYEAVLFHRGPLSETEEGLSRELMPTGMVGQLRANLRLRRVDLEQNPMPEDLELSRSAKVETFPKLVVRYPVKSGLASPIWSAPLTLAGLREIMDSPVRKEIAQRLGQGQNAVWVFLQSGDPQKDSAAAALLEARLTYLKSVLKLPKLEAQDIVNGLISVGQEDLKVDFSVLRLARTDASERVFVNMLLGTESDLHDTREPMAFPVFGRGRVLYALIGPGINHETIDEAASFLIGHCSCEVKEQNPGVDLLIAADWDGMVKRKPNSAPPTAVIAKVNESVSETAASFPASDRTPSQPNQQSALPETVTISGNENPTKAMPSSSALPPGTWGYQLGRGIAFAALLAVVIFLVRRK